MFADQEFSEAWEPGTVDGEPLEDIKFEDSDD
jgi:hypothetical protein